MRTRFIASTIFAGFAALPWALMPAAAQSIPRTADGKPDLSGYWNLPYMPNLAFGKEAEVPYTPAGAEAFKNRDAKDDPTGLCLPPGMPRIMHSPFPMAIFQTRDQIAMLFEYQRIWRIIDISGHGHNTDTGPTFMGDSIGHWEGDTLVIETTALNDRSWLDTTGHQHSARLRVLERLRRTADGITLEETINDPVMYSKPWTHENLLKPLQASAGLPMLLEYFCNDNNVDIQHLVGTKSGSGNQ